MAPLTTYTTPADCSDPTKVSTSITTSTVISAVRGFLSTIGAKIHSHDRYKYSQALDLIDGQDKDLATRYPTNLFMKQFNVAPLDKRYISSSSSSSTSKAPLIVGMVCLGILILISIAGAFVRQHLRNKIKAHNRDIVAMGGTPVPMPTHDHGPMNTAVGGIAGSMNASAGMPAGGGGA